MKNKLELIILISRNYTADFINRVTKAEDAFRWGKHSFKKAFNRNNKEATKVQLEYDPMFSSITKLVRSIGNRLVFNGEPANLFTQLKSMIEEEYTVGTIPSNCASYSKRLLALKPDFYEVGINISFHKSGERQIIIKRINPEDADFGMQPLESGLEGSRIDAPP